MTILLTLDDEILHVHFIHVIRHFRVKSRGLKGNGNAPKLSCFIMFMKTEVQICTAQCNFSLIYP